MSHEVMTCGQTSPLAMSGQGRMFMRFWGIPYRVKLLVMQGSPNRFARGVTTSEGAIELSTGAPTMRIGKVVSDLLSLAEAPVVIAIDLLGLLDAVAGGRRRLRPARAQAARVSALSDFER